MMAFSEKRLPSTINLKALSFYSSWYGGLVNLKRMDEEEGQVFSFGHVYRNEETEISKAVAIIEEHNRFSLENRSMIWRIAEIDVERQNEWLIFSRVQSDFSSEALSDFVVDSKNYRDHLRDQNKRLNPA